MLYIYIFCDDQLSSGILDRECIGCGNGASVDGQRPAAAAACANTQRSSNTRVGWTVSIAIGSLPPTNQRLWAVWPTFPLPHVHQRQLPPPGTNTGHRTRGKKQTFFLWTKESWLLFFCYLSLSLVFLIEKKWSKSLCLAASFPDRTANDVKMVRRCPNRNS